MNFMINVRVEHPKTKAEARTYGLTSTRNNAIDVYIQKRQAKKEMIDTYFHEMTHVILSQIAHRISAKKEEELCRLIGGAGKLILGSYL